MGHGVGDEDRCETAAPVDVEDGEDPEQDEGGDHVAGPDDVAGDAVVDGHYGRRDNDLKEPGGSAALRPVHDEAAHGDLLAEGQHEADGHHDGALPEEGQRVASAHVAHRGPGQAVDDGDDDHGAGGGPPPAQLGEALAAPALAPPHVGDDDEAADEEDDVEDEGAGEARAPGVVDPLGADDEAASAQHQPQHGGGEPDLPPGPAPTQGRVRGGGRSGA